MTLGPAIVGLASAAALALAVASAIAAVPGSEAPCTPAKVAPSVGMLAASWRAAAEELSQATAVPGMPWSCVGGSIEIAEHEGGATLTVITADGRMIARDVTAPEEVVPLGEALLAKPLPPPPPSPPAAPPKAAPAEEEPPKAVPLAEPRLLLGALIGPRYAGKTQLLWGGLTASVSVPIGAWGVGVWGRYDGPAVSLTPRPAAMHEVCFGASASRSFMLRSIELRASVVPSVAVVTRAFPENPFGGKASPFDSMLPSETRTEGRIGLDARAVVPITNALRLVSALDVELSPRALAEKRAPHSYGWPLADYPSYTLGFGLGLEIAVR